MAQIERITEGYKNCFDLFFSFVGAEGQFDRIVFLKGKPGNAPASGFTFLVPHSIETWDEFLDFISGDSFKEFWLERNGFAVEKYFFKLVEFFGPVYKGAPEAPAMNLSGRFSIPNLEATLVYKFGINPNAYENY